MIYWLLFYEFFKIGLFAIGGGLVTVPFLFDLTARYDWFTTQELADMIAVSESTPGPLGVNMATYVGYSTAGIRGRLGRNRRFGGSFGYYYCNDSQIVAPFREFVLFAGLVGRGSSGGAGAYFVCRNSHCQAGMGELGKCAYRSGFSGGDTLG